MECRHRPQRVSKVFFTGKGVCCHCQRKIRIDESKSSFFLRPGVLFFIGFTLLSTFKIEIAHRLPVNVLSLWMNWGVPSIAGVIAIIITIINQKYFAKYELIEEKSDKSGK